MLKAPCETRPSKAQAARAFLSVRINSRGKRTIAAASIITKAKVILSAAIISGEAPRADKPLTKRPIVPHKMPAMKINSIMLGVPPLEVSYGEDELHALPVILHSVGFDTCADVQAVRLR